MEKAKSYRSRWWGQALKETLQFWSSHRIVMTIAGPILAALFWALLNGWKGWMGFLTYITLAVLLFGFSWGIVFFVSLIRAPRILDEQCQKIVIELSNKLEIPDKALAEHLLELLRNVGSNEKRIVQFLLWHGETTATRVKIPGITEKEIHKSLDVCVSENLIKTKFVPPVTSSPRNPSSIFDFVEGTTFYFVPGELRDTLRLLLAE